MSLKIRTIISVIVGLITTGLVYVFIDAISMTYILSMYFVVGFGISFMSTGLLGIVNLTKTITIKETVYILLFVLVILLFSNEIYKAVKSPLNFLGLLNFERLISYISMFYIGNFLLPKKIKDHELANNYYLLILIAVFIYCVYIVSNITFYKQAFYILINGGNLFFNRPLFYPTTIAIAWLTIFLLHFLFNTTLSNPNASKTSNNKLVSFFVLLFGLLFILDKNISGFLWSIKHTIILLSESSIMNTEGVNWMPYIKSLLTNTFILVLFWSFSVFIESKINNDFKNIRTLIFALIPIMIVFYYFHWYLQKPIYSLML